MKKVTIALFMGIVALGWVSCKKKSSATPDPVIPKGIYTKINGIPWTATQISHFADDSYIDLSGYDTTGKSIDLRINNYKKRGTFNVPQPNDSAFYDVDFGFFANPVNGTAGQIAIQALTDTTVGGTFHFTAGSMVVTDGTFNVNFN